MALVGVLDRSRGVSRSEHSAALCITALGAELTAYLAGAASVDELESWLADPAAGDRFFAVRVAAAADVIDVFATHNQVALASVWLRGVDAEHGIPARMLRTSTSDPAKIKNLLAVAASRASAGLDGAVTPTAG
jgi:hypothetical protein